jgi:F-type H+-transporting ATPase subunit gamma
LGHVDIFCLGKQGERLMKHHGMNVSGSRNEIFDKLTFGNVSVFISEIMKAYADGVYDRVEIIYNQFKNAAVQDQVTEQFLPVEMDTGETNQSSFDFIYEPSKEEIIRDLIPRSLKIQFFKAMLDSHAAEHGARNTAMHLATDNATELLREHTLQYNKERQSTITSEILEIVSGAEALKG